MVAGLQRILLKLTKIKGFGQLSTISFNSFPTLKKGSFLGFTLIASPVFGLRPTYGL
jgi:hypothetical protein